MLTECSRDLFGYEGVEGRQVVAAFDGGEVTSDAGGLLLGATDRAIGLVARFAACFDDGRVRRLAPRGDLGGRPGAPTRSSTRSRRWWRSGCSALRSATRI
jgi:Transposase DDE domain group 1